MIYQVGDHTARSVVARKYQVPIMVFVGNHGILQIFNGEVQQLVDHKRWFNVR